MNLAHDKPTNPNWLGRLRSALFQKRFDVRLTITLKRTPNSLGTLIVLLSGEDALIRELTSAQILGDAVVLVVLRLRDEAHFQQTLLALQSTGFRCVVTDPRGKDIYKRISPAP